MVCKLHQKCMPQRVFVCLMAFLGLTIGNMMRFSMSLVLTFIAIPKQKKFKASECEVVRKNETVTREIIFEWDEKTQGQILGAFFYGYILTQMPAGIISDLFGPRRIAFWSTFLTSIITFLVGPITHIFDWIGLFVIRLFTGLFQGAFYASLHAVVAVWVPKTERGRLGTFVFVGAHMGNFGSVTITGFILYGLGQKRWEWLFYIYGGCGILWALLFFFMTYDNHTKCPEGLLKESEKSKLDDYYNSIKKKEKVKFFDMPWKYFATNLPVYALAVGLWGHCWGIFVMINNIPKFMASVLGFDVKSNGMYLGGAYLLMVLIAFASSAVVDWIEKKKLMSLTWNRIIFTTIGSALPSLGLIGVTYCECDGTCAFVCLIIGFGCMGTFYPSLKVNGIDLSTNYGGTIGATGHWLGTTAGAMGPPLVAAIAPDSTISQYRIVMWLSFILMSATNIFYILFASANVQKFNYYQPKPKEPAK
ncbi:putative inorganic phosphate cotransporter [Halyomorpha halys]|uniref:putative inorganic phosphate cotransporter n=1 Tax=Halyomorpha halys TaxID=286706 RepID=UPI0006D52362|nr:putative inorganic phosphate cotransporter isoform X1 [Halyomorpha halys]